MTKKRYRFEERKTKADAAGFILERDNYCGHQYCLWVNSPTGSKEIWIKNLGEEFERAYNELVKIMYNENK